MPLEWTPALSVGIAEIDDQHRELFRRAARLIEGIRGGDAASPDELLGFLHRYAVSHFGAEEAAMREASYPGYARHKAEHDRFIADLLGVAEDRDLKGGGLFTALKLDHWLGMWLREHVSATDAELGIFLRKRST